MGLRPYRDTITRNEAKNAYFEDYKQKCPQSSGSNPAKYRHVKNW